MRDSEVLPMAPRRSAIMSPQEVREHMETLKNLTIFATKPPKPTPKLTVRTRAACIEHLREQHGYRDEVDDWKTFFAGTGNKYGILDFIHWPDWELIEFHDADHNHDYPETGTPVKGWAHHHRKDES